ncbi:MAG: carboxypeptidase-like regulatory domain-containing protein [Planctomycetes bacterium]|nr:carboxypeptidase-like regulatory domain-containing protein [Planctomycetota bacterium]
MVNELQGGHRGPRLKLVGVHEGEYTLTAHARGYTGVTIKKSSVKGGEMKEVGSIGLDPCGVLKLEVVDTSGEPIDPVRIICNGKEVHEFNRENTGPGQWQCPELPIGNVSLLVSAEGYVAKETTLDLKPGQPAKLRIMLSSE